MNLAWLPVLLAAANFGLHGGKLEFLRPADLSRGLRQGESLEGDRVVIQGDRLIVRMIICTATTDCQGRPASLSFLAARRPDRPWTLEATLRADLAAGKMRVVRLRRRRPE